MSTTTPPTPLTHFRALSFDIYGTLIDWNTALLAHFAPLLSRAPTHPLTYPTALLAAFAHHEQTLQRESPTLPYNTLLARGYEAIAAEMGVEAPPGEAEKFAGSIGAWEAFGDTVAAMHTLGKYYKLIAISNITNAAIKKTLAGPLKGVEFDDVYTAEEIGSYKPDHRNFEYLLKGVKELGVEKGELLHVAHGVKSDMVPAGEMGIARAWIWRGDDQGALEEVEGTEGVGWRWGTLGEMAKDVERAFGGEGKQG